MPPTKPPTLLLLDWDSTLTTTSTLPHIASIATHPSLHPNLPPLSAAYSADLTHHDTTYCPAKPQRKTLEQELTYLSSLHGVEKRSVERVEACGIFRNVCVGDVDGAAVGCWEGGSIALRSGWRRLVESVQRQGEVAIVSVAWSRRFIATSLREADRAAGGDKAAVGDIAVVANEISADGSGMLDRYFERRDGGGGVWSADDKAAVMEGFVSRGEGKPVVVFIGDSVTDLACLVNADVGVCIRDEVLTGEQEGLREVLERVGVECVSVKEFAGGGQGLEGRRKEPGKGKIWWARDFDEVFESGVLDWMADVDG